MKKADRNLIAVMITCAVLGLMLLAFTLHTYLKHQLQADMDYNKPVPVSVYAPLLDSLRVFTFQLVPFMAVMLFVIAFVIWDYRRKRGAMSEHDKPDVSNN